MRRRKHQVKKLPRYLGPAVAASVLGIKRSELTALIKAGVFTRGRPVNTYDLRSYSIRTSLVLIYREHLRDPVTYPWPPQPTQERLGMARKAGELVKRGITVLEEELLRQQQERKGGSL